MFVCMWVAVGLLEHVFEDVHVCMYVCGLLLCCLRMYMFVCMWVAVVLFEDVHVRMYVGCCCFAGACV